MKAVDQDELQTITLSNFAGITDIFGRHLTRDFDELLTGLCGAPTKTQRLGRTSIRGDDRPLRAQGRPSRDEMRLESDGAGLAVR